MHRTVLKLALIFQNEIQKRMNLSEIISPKTFLLSQPSWIGHIISNSKSNHYILHIHNWWIVIMIFRYIWIWMALILLCSQMQYLSWRRFIFLYTLLGPKCICIFPQTQCNIWAGGVLYFFVFGPQGFELVNQYFHPPTFLWNNPRIPRSRILSPKLTQWTWLQFLLLSAAKS